MSIDLSFYKNVFLLTQLVPPSYNFTKHFKKGMFDRPNTTGFVYVTHYLLTIYDAKRFKKLITWPIMNKADEKMYRTEVKRYLEILSDENSDINFPSILLSHLLQAGGTKFTIIMWKVSQIALRAYISRECQFKLLTAPKIGHAKELAEENIRNINLKRDIVLTKLYDEIKSISEMTEAYIKYTSNDIYRIKIEIFKTAKDIERHLPQVPVNPLIAKRLLDVEDMEIIELWKASIEKSLKQLCSQNKRLKKVECISTTLCGLIRSLRAGSKAADAKEFVKVDNQSILELPFYPDIQHLIHDLYANDSLVFQVFLSILHHVLKQILGYLKRNILLDYSIYELQIRSSNEAIKSAQVAFQEMSIHTSELLFDTHCILEDKFSSHTPEFDHPCLTINDSLIIVSPKIKFLSDKYIDEEDIFDRLSISPEKGKYKDLFKRYQRNFLDTSNQSMTMLHMNNYIYNSTFNWKSPQRRSQSNKKDSPNTTNISPTYSRLFSIAGSKRSYFKEKNAASTPNHSGLDITPKKSDITETSSISKVNIDIVAKNIFNLSCEVTNAIASLCGSPRHSN